MASVQEFEKRETARIREHLVGALTLLREADTSHLLSETRARRQSVAADLERYIERARFPRNLQTLEQRPALIDDLGTRCALAHLAEQSGGKRLIGHLSLIANHERVAVLRTHADLQGWLASVGLTAEEAARIQPSYVKMPHPTPLECACWEMSALVARGTVISTQPSGAASHPCEVRIDKVLHQGISALEAGQTSWQQCTNAGPGSQVLITRTVPLKWSIDGEAINVHPLTGGGQALFKTCEPASVQGGPLWLQGEPPNPVWLTKTQLDSVVGKSNAECRAFFKLKPEGWEPRAPQPPGVIKPNPEESRPAKPTASPSASASSAPRKSRDNEEPRETGSAHVGSTSAEGFDMAAVHYVGGGALLGAVVGVAVFGLRGRKV
ncbi:MAG: hypothetical protein HOV80_09285 [Polyangiaceae bacterium]|nr:hypothetical protein [Polyangiaceae bacterium]